MFHSDARRRQTFAYIYGMFLSPHYSQSRPWISMSAYDSLTHTLSHMQLSRVSLRRITIWELANATIGLFWLATPCFLRFLRRCFRLIFAGMNLVPDKFSGASRSMFLYIDVVADATASSNTAFKSSFYKENKICRKFLQKNFLI